MHEDNSFFTISKTADIVGVQSHVLRFWEKKFPIIKPKKNVSGRRYYSSTDIEYLHMIKKLLYDDGFTIKGAINLINSKYKNNEIFEKSSVPQNIDKAISLIKEGYELIDKNLD